MCPDMLRWSGVSWDLWAWWIMVRWPFGPSMQPCSTGWDQLVSALNKRADDANFLGLLVNIGLDPLHTSRGGLSGQMDPGLLPCTDRTACRFAL